MSHKSYLVEATFRDKLATFGDEQPGHCARKFKFELERQNRVILIFAAYYFWWLIEKPSARHSKSIGSKRAPGHYDGCDVDPLLQFRSVVITPPAKLVPSFNITATPP